MINRLLLLVLCGGIALSAAEPRYSYRQAEALRKVASDGVREGNTNKAAAATEALIRLDPNDATLRYFSAGVYERLGNLERALKEADVLVRTSSGMADAHMKRGAIRFKLRDFKGSVDDYKKASEAEPSMKAQNWQLGISQFYAGLYKEGKAQFELHESVNGNDFENTAWHFYCTAKAESPARAKELLLKNGPDSRIPMKQLYEFYKGTGSAEQVLAATEAGDPTRVERRERLFYAHLYLGLYYDVTGDKEKARQHMQAAAEDYKAPGNYMWEVARVHWEEMTNKPKPGSTASARAEASEGSGTVSKPAPGN